MFPTSFKRCSVDMAAMFTTDLEVDSVVEVESRNVSGLDF